MRPPVQPVQLLYGQSNDIGKKSTRYQYTRYKPSNI